MADETENPRIEMAARNRAIIERWAREGDSLDPNSIMGLRMDVMVDMLWPEGSAFREMFEAAFEANLNTRLQQLDSERGKAKLLEGVTAGPNTHILQQGAM